MKLTTVTCVKNEGPFLLEWIAFHRILGVTDFLFYSNDCSDATDEMLDALEGHGIVKHLPNPAQGRNYQMEALKDARHQQVVQDADWVWIADVDEFLNIHCGDHTIPALIEACGDPQAISVTFQFFANMGITAYEDAPVIAQFTKSHNPDIWCDQTSIEVKSLVRKDFPLGYYGAHRPFLKRGTEELPVWKDGGGRNVPNNYKLAVNKRRIRQFPTKGGRSLATLNHYALRSLDSYLVKNDRGDVNRDNRNFDDSYWRERNDAAYEDTSIHRYLPKLKAEMARLKKLKGISALHDKAVAAHIATRDRLMARADYQALAEQLKNTGGIGPAEQALIEKVAAA